MVDCDELETKPEYQDGDFSPGMDVYYKSGDGNNQEAKYPKHTVSNGVEFHSVKLSTGKTVKTNASHLQLLEQPDLTNIPTDIDTYCKEVKTGVTEEDIKQMARPQSLTPLQQELVFWHNQLYHLTFHHLISMSRLCIIPKHLAKCINHIPICVSCQFGQAHKRQWCNKGKSSNSIRKQKDNQPGDCVSTDQMVSAQPGLVPQMAGFLTSERIWAVTIFVDHATDWCYGHTMHSLELNETLLPKRAFEKLVTHAGHEVKCYHADNGRYADTGFLALH